MRVKRLLDCTPSQLAGYGKAELLAAIAGCEGRVLACECIGITPPRFCQPGRRSAVTGRL